MVDEIYTAEFEDTGLWTLFTNSWLVWLLFGLGSC